MGGDPLGLRRVVAPRGVLPQRADVLDPSLPPGEDELLIDVESLNIDAASFRQIEKAEGHDVAKIAAHIQQIVTRRGKMHNPVTGSGGMLIGKVARVGPAHPAASALRPGDRIATLVSLSLTPLRIDAILAVHPKIDRVDIRGQAVLFASGIYARLPTDLPETLALAALDVCGAPALVARHVKPGMTVLVLGAGKSGALCAAQARKSLAGTGRVLALDISEAAIARFKHDALIDDGMAVDATNAVATLQAFERISGGRAADLVVNVASVPETEMAAILCAAQGGAIIFFSMATSFTAAALGAEGLGKDLTMYVGNGYAPGHADLTLNLVRSVPAIRALFEERYVG
jgi:L-erythro-3,5-diaminohexanoate dehydrogenase